MSITARVVTWGDDLFVRAGRATGGLKAAVDRIRSVVGSEIGVRNSFTPLFDVTNPANMNDKFAWRAWLLLTALGQNPSEWGVYDDVVPAFYAARIDDLRDMLCTPRDLNPEPTGYGTPGIFKPIRPRGRADRSTGPQNRKR